MKKAFNNISIACTVLFVSLFTSCADPSIIDEPEVIGEGTAEISGAVSFRSYGSALSRAAGNVLDGINDLTVLAYTEDGKSLVKAQKFTKSTGLTITNNNTQAPSDAVNPDNQPTSIGRFDLQLPYGRYKIFAVANMNIDINSEYAKTIDGLRSHQAEWSSSMSTNNEMFGYFSTATPGAIQSTNFDADGVLQAPTVTVNQRNLTLSAWLVRLASKITVAFDGSGLKNNVAIYIKSVELKDIPKSCSLGVRNTPDAADELIPSGGVKLYYDPQKYPNGGPQKGDFTIQNYQNYITNGHPSLTGDYANPHGHNSDALFFFENDQGMGKDKAQDAVDNSTITGNGFGSGNPDNIMDFPNGNDPADRAWKDAKRYGSYIEVQAYYVSRNEGNQSQGNIVYRFMLGQDIKTNYRALRNYHYKLTLKFNGFANDPDWHIVYEKEKFNMNSPNPHFISYLYNRSMMLPIDITTGQAQIQSIKVNIKKNGWAPVNVDPTYAYMGEAPNGNNSVTLGLYNKYYLYDANMADTDNPWNGFLSVTPPGNETTVDGDPPYSPTSNQAHYNAHGEGSRTYSNITVTDPNITPRQCMENNNIHVALRNDGTNNIYTVNIPFWTRAKNLIKGTGYTANNPFVAYEREAEVEVEALLSDGRIITNGLNAATGEQGGGLLLIKQVRRVVNPKGIYRRAGNNRDFKVTLKTLPTENSTQFENIPSDGAWRAYVFRDTQRGTGKSNAADWNQRNEGTIWLDGAAAEPGEITIQDMWGLTRTYATIEGKGGDIEFTVHFNGKTPADGSNNNAIIRVEYNNNTCYHLIFVRQGYEPEAIHEGAAKFSCFNNLAKGVMATSPLDEGSMFKYGNWDDAISSENNVNGKTPWTLVTPNDFALNAAGTKSLKLYGGGSKTWANINYNANGNFSGNGNGYHVATAAEWNALLDDDATEQGYGVLYGDDATQCASSTVDAYEYDAAHPTRGMRGCFVYDSKNGRNFFLPVGKSGYGRRKHTLTAGSNTYNGVLRYSSNARWGYFNAVSPTAYPHGVNDAPLFFDIFRSEGATYWYQSRNGTAGAAWDINYYTFDFSEIGWANLGSGRDAMFIRCVKD